MTERLTEDTHLESVRAELPLLVWTPRSWAELAANQLDVFLADHAICEQQAALFGLSLIGHYPDDHELVVEMGKLAAEEVSHMRRVHAILHRRGFSPSTKRGNPWVQALRKHAVTDRGPLLKLDRLFVGALIEARSCERFTTLLDVVAERDEEIGRLLVDLGPAEKRHWQTFHHLASRDVDSATFDSRWQGWLEVERDASATLGVRPTVHG